MGVPLSTVMPAVVREAWGLGADDDATPLPGGLERSIRVHDVVYKPVDDVGEARWGQECLASLSAEGVRVPAPVRSPAGQWVAAGWMASSWVDGAAGPSGRWDALLEASRRFHAALSGVPRPPVLAQRSHRWARADRAAWHEGPITWLPPAAPLADSFDRIPLPARLPSQIIHGDLSGNVLLHPTLPPAVIDFSPYWRPAPFADAVLLVDGLLWYEWDDVIPHVPRTPTFLELLARAALFRLGALNEYARTVDASGFDELPLYVRLAEWLHETLG